MRILFSQKGKKSDDYTEKSLFNDYGISNCYFKWISLNGSESKSTNKRHSHTGYEFHIVLSGSQRYETSNGDFLVESGQFLAIPKGKPHRLASVEYPIEKYAVTFSVDESAGGFRSGFKGVECQCLYIPERVISNIRAVSELAKFGSPLSARIIENCVFETAVLLLRELGVNEAASVSDEIAEKNVDGRVEIAKQFILDNVESPLQVGEVAAYCYISEKQLTRLFYSHLGKSPAEYIRLCRVRRIEELLRDPSVSLYEITERMGFPNESGFNAFFRKYNGMPPGEYRKMITSGK